MEPESLLEAELRQPLHREAQVDAPVAEAPGLDDQAIPVRSGGSGPRLLPGDLRPGARACAAAGRGLRGSPATVSLISLRISRSSWNGGPVPRSLCAMAPKMNQSGRTNPVMAPSGRSSIFTISCTRPSTLVRVPLGLGEARRGEEGVHLERRAIDVLGDDVIAVRPLEEGSLPHEVEDLGPGPALQEVGQGDAVARRLPEPGEELAEDAELEGASRVGAVEERQERRSLPLGEPEQGLAELAVRRRRRTPPVRRRRRGPCPGPGPPRPSRAPPRRRRSRGRRPRRRLPCGSPATSAPPGPGAPPLPCPATGRSQWSRVARQVGVPGVDGDERRPFSQGPPDLDSGHGEGEPANRGRRR